MNPYFTKGLLAASLICFADQLSKWIMLDVVRIQAKSPIEVTPFFNLVMVWNPGISFGMLQGIEYGAYLLTALALAISVFLLIWLRKSGHLWESVALGLVIGGALGNVIDRLRFGAVADFFDFHIAGYHWPAFNIADSSIVVGTLLLCFYLLYQERSQAKYRNHEKDSSRSPSV